MSFSEDIDNMSFSEEIKSTSLMSSGPCYQQDPLTQPTPSIDPESGSYKNRYIGENKQKNICEKYREIFKFIGIFVSIVISIAIIVCIYIFVLRKLISDENKCYEKVADNKVLAEILKKDNWYVFQYNNHNCSAPKDNSLSGKKSGTYMYVYFSDDLKHCSLSKEDGDECTHKIFLFTLFFSIFGIAIIFYLMIFLSWVVCYPCTRMTIKEYLK